MISGADLMHLGWLDCSSGVSGDMLLGALVAAGVPLETLQAAVDAAVPEPVNLVPSTVRRAGLAATRVDVQCALSRSHRTWGDIRGLLERADGLSDRVRATALGTFELLATAEARVHGEPPDRVHFHEVGALDAIADVVGVCAGFDALGMQRLEASSVAVGSGVVRAAHGRLPIPAPAVVELLTGVPTYGDDSGIELTTPTGAALLRQHVTGWGAQPAMQVTRQAFGAGMNDLPDRPNVLRLLVGEGAGQTEAALLLEANVDDLDPRLWPVVLTRLLEIGASDAWLVPILMKKGRPAHTLCVLVDEERSAAVRQVMYRETSTIGLREHRVRKRPLDRATHLVQVGGQPVRIKVASLDSVVVNAQPEYDDIVAVATSTGRPVKEMLTEAMFQARLLGLVPGAAGDDPESR